MNPVLTVTDAVLRRRISNGTLPTTLFLLVLLGSLVGCATAPRTQLQVPPRTFPADALITQRGVLTIFGGRQVTLNGYLATSATNGHRLVLTENFGSVLADVLLTPDGKAHVMKSSRAFKSKWVERYIATDVRCLLGLATGDDCPGQWLASDRVAITRRWYRLELQTVSITPGPQPVELFDPPKSESR